VCADRQDSRDRFTEIESTWADLVSEYEPLAADIKALYASGVLTQTGADVWDLNAVLQASESGVNASATDGDGAFNENGNEDKKRRRSSAGQYVLESSRKKR